MWRAHQVVLIVSLALACGAVLSAQKDKEDSNTRVVQGQVIDSANKAVVGAVVKLKDMRTLQIRSFITQDRGDYRFAGLRSDIDYELKAEFNGASSDTKRLTVFDTRKMATIDLKLGK